MLKEDRDLRIQGTGELVAKRDREREIVSSVPHNLKRGRCMARAAVTLLAAAQLPFFTWMAEISWPGQEGDVYLVIQERRRVARSRAATVRRCFAFYIWIESHTLSRYIRSSIQSIGQRTSDASKLFDSLDSIHQFGFKNFLPR